MNYKEKKKQYTSSYILMSIRVCRVYADTYTHTLAYAYADTHMRKSKGVFRVYFGTLISERYCKFAFG